MAQTTRREFMLGEGSGTGGGPQNSTRVLAVEVFNRAFVTHQIGRAATITVVMLVFLGVMIFWFMAVRRQDATA